MSIVFIYDSKVQAFLDHGDVRCFHTEGTMSNVLLNFTKKFNIDSLP